jgi:hypothetical protein
MKKYYLSLFLAFLLFRTVKAQVATTTNTSTVLVNNSYVANTYIYVHPYLLPPATQTAPTTTATAAPPSDYDAKIVFRLNKGNKFFVNKIISTGTAITGYVISTWNYNSKLAEKNSFYRSLTASSNTQSNSALLKQNVADKQASVKVAKDDVEKKTQDVTSAQSTVTAAQTALDNARLSFFSTSLYYDAKKILPQTMISDKNGIKPEVSSFLNAQSKALNQTVEESTTSSATQDELLQQSIQLPVVANSAFAKLKDNYQKAKADAQTALQKLTTAHAALTTTSNTLKDAENALKTAQENLLAANSQISTEPKETEFYKIKKPQVGDAPDDVAGDTNPAVAFDQLAYLDSWANGWQFYMSAKDFSDNCTMIYPHSLGFTWGFLTLPLKLRFDNPQQPGGEFNFEQNLNFGLTMGLKQQWISTTDVSMNYLVGISVVDVPLNNAVPASSTQPAGVPATSTTAVSTSLGAMFQYSKFQIGIFGGLDFAGQHADQFPFQGRFWLGFAIGVSLFGEGQTSASKQNQN